METLAMSVKERRRLEVLSRVKGGRVASMKARCVSSNESAREFWPNLLSERFGRRDEHVGDSPYG